LRNEISKFHTFDITATVEKYECNVYIYICGFILARKFICVTHVLELARVNKNRAHITKTNKGVQITKT